MRDYYADDLLIIASTITGVRLFGEVIGAHKGPLLVALARQRRNTEEITVDLSGVHYLSNSALETLVAIANCLRPPQHLLLRSYDGLGLQERLTAAGWERIETLRLDAWPSEADTSPSREATSPRPSAKKSHNEHPGDCSQISP